MQGGRYCDPDLLGLAQVDVDAQVDAEADAEFDLLIALYCMNNPSLP